MSSVIKMENVTYTYPGDETLKNMYAVKDLSFEINEGEFVAILGHNGSGKSTTAKLMNMILKPDSGKIYINGKDVTDDGITENDVYEVRKNDGTGIPITR